MFRIPSFVVASAAIALVASPCLAGPYADPAFGFSREVLVSAERACTDAGGSFSGRQTEFACRLAHGNGRGANLKRFEEICTHANGRYTGDSHICLAARHGG